MLTDPRVRKLADLLVNHSVRTGKGDHVLIETFDCPDFVAAAVAEQVQKSGQSKVSMRTWSPLPVRTEWFTSRSASLRTRGSVSMAAD